MPELSFFLNGKDSGEAQNVHMVRIDNSHSFEEALTAIADSFSVLVPKGILLENQNGQVLNSTEDLVRSDGKIGVSFLGSDGKSHAVREVSGPKGLPYFGNTLEIYPDHLGNRARLFKQYGSVMKTTEGKTVYFTNDPEVSVHVFQESQFWSKLITDSHPVFPFRNEYGGLFVSDTTSEAWHSTHKYLANCMSPRAIKHYTPMMQQSAEAAFSIFDEFDQKEEAWDVFTYMSKLASQTMGKLGLGVDFHHFDNPDSPEHQTMAILAENLALGRKISQRGAWYAHLPFGESAKLKASFAKFNSLIDRCIADIRAQDPDAPNLPIAEAALQAKCIADFADRAVDENGEKLPRKFLASGLAVIIGAGFTTTAALMSWIIFRLTTHPEVQQRLLQELIDAGVNESTKWTMEKTSELPYLDALIKETQRLNNPAFQPARTALRDMIIPGGYKVSKGTVMVCAIRDIMTNQNHWKDPARFDPDRWFTDEVKKRHIAAYTPFAIGPRSCIGFNFALQEAKIAIALLVYRYEFFKYGEDMVEVDPESILVRPTNFFVHARRRTERPAHSF